MIRLEALSKVYYTNGRRNLVADRLNAEFPTGASVGLSKTASRDILCLLQSYVTRPENVVRVVWEPDQLVIFDHQITQRYAPDNYDGLPRRLERVTVAGEVPVGIDGERSRSITGIARWLTAQSFCGASAMRAPFAPPRLSVSR